MASFDFWAGAARLMLDGEDALTWLQGQLTQELRAGGSDAKEAALCDPKGHLLDHCRVSPGQGVMIETYQPRLYERLVEERVILEDVRLAVVRQIANPPDGTSALLHGYPLLGRDYDGKSLLPELGEDFVSRTVSRTKGCYVGQEIIQRVYARGHVNWKWAGLKSLERAGRGDKVTEGSEPVGTVLGAEWHPDFGHIASVRVKESVSVTAKLQVGGHPVELVELPFSVLN